MIRPSASPDPGAGEPGSHHGARRRGAAARAVPGGGGRPARHAPLLIL